MYKFWDLQCSVYSAHTTLEGIAEMCIDGIDWEYPEGSFEDRIIKKAENGELKKEDMRMIVESFEYQIREYKLVPGFGKRFTFGK